MWLRLDCEFNFESLQGELEAIKEMVQLSEQSVNERMCVGSKLAPSMVSYHSNVQVELEWKLAKQMEKQYSRARMH